jgi:hypothetical protein
MKKMDAKVENSKKDMASDKKMAGSGEKAWVKSVQKRAGYNFGGMVKKGKKGC